MDSVDGDKKIRTRLESWASTLKTIEAVNPPKRRNNFSECGFLDG